MAKSAKHNAELSRLLVNLDKKTALIFAAGAGKGAKQHHQKDRENPPVYLRALEAPTPAGNVFAQQYPQWDLSQPRPSELAATAALNVKGDKRRRAAT